MKPQCNTSAECLRELARVMDQSTIQEVKLVADKCGSIEPRGVYPKAVLFYPKQLQAFYQHAYEEGRKMQRESDAILVKRHPDAQLATLGDWTLTVATVLNEAIRNNTGE